MAHSLLMFAIRAHLFMLNVACTLCVRVSSTAIGVASIVPSRYISCVFALLFCFSMAFVRVESIVHSFFFRAPSCLEPVFRSRSKCCSRSFGVRPTHELGPRVRAGVKKNCDESTHRLSNRLEVCIHHNSFLARMLTSCLLGCALLCVFVCVYVFVCLSVYVLVCFILAWCLHSSCVCLSLSVSVCIYGRLSLPWRGSLAKGVYKNCSEATHRLTIRLEV
jgi:hypothetical protein